MPLLSSLRIRSEYSGVNTVAFVCSRIKVTKQTKIETSLLSTNFAKFSDDDNELTEEWSQLKYFGMRNKIIILYNLIQPIFPVLVPVAE